MALAKLLEDHPRLQREVAAQGRYVCHGNRDWTGGPSCLCICEGMKDLPDEFWRDAVAVLFPNQAQHQESHAQLADGQPPCRPLLTLR